MRANVQLSFEFGKLSKRETVSQKQFLTQNRQFLLKFQRLVYESHEKLLKSIFALFSPSEMDRNMPAVAMISFIRQGLIRSYPLYCQRATRGRFELLAPGREKMLVKKLNSKFRPCNIDTDNNDEIICQLTSDKSDKGPNIFLGYTSPSKCPYITGVYAVCIDGDEEIWRTNIADLNSDQSGVTPLKPKNNGPRLKPGVARQKKTKKE